MALRLSDTHADIPAWYRPILTPKTVLPLFFAIGIIFAPIGGLLLYASAQVRKSLKMLSVHKLLTDVASGTRNCIGLLRLPQEGTK